MDRDIVLRAMGPADGPALAELDRSSPDTGAISFSTCYLCDAYLAFLALHPGAVGVVAEAAGRSGIVGMGAMSLGRARWEGVERGYAYLFSIGVHPQYRRRGIASAMYDRLIAEARSRLGPDAVIVAGMQEDNVGSVRAAQRWSTHLVRRTATLITTMRRRPPRQRAGLLVRPAADGEWEAIAEAQNAFYARHNLYPARSGAALKELHEAAPFAARIREYFVALDPAGRIIAGMSVTEEGALEPLEIVRIPAPLRAANALLRVLPADRLMRRVPARDLWYAPGRSDALAYLWSSVRWLMRDRGSMLMAFVDPIGPLARAIKPMPLLPRSGGYLAIAAPVAPSAERPIYHHS